MACFHIPSFTTHLAFSATPHTHTPTPFPSLPLFLPHFTRAARRARAHARFQTARCARVRTRARSALLRTRIFIDDIKNFKKNARAYRIDVIVIIFLFVRAHAHARTLPQRALRAIHRARTPAGTYPRTRMRDAQAFWFFLRTLRRFVASRMRARAKQNFCAQAGGAGGHAHAYAHNLFFN